MQALVGSISGEDNYIQYDVFDIIKEHSVELTSDITDYYVEDNTAVQDNISLKPPLVTVSGYMGELVSSTDRPISGAGSFTIQSVAQKMDTLDILNPVMPTQITQARAKISQLADKAELYKSIVATDLNIAKNAYGVAKGVLAKFGNPNIKKVALKGTANQEIYDKLKRQAEAFVKFYELRQAKSLCTVVTPWGRFSNMAIQTLTARMSEDSEYISDFSITFKKFNSAKTKFAKFDLQQFRSSISQSQMSEMTEMGKSTGQQQDESILYELFHR